MFQLLTTAEFGMEGPLQSVEAACMAGQPDAMSDPEHSKDDKQPTVAQEHRIWAKHFQETGGKTKR